MRLILNASALSTVASSPQYISAPAPASASQQKLTIQLPTQPQPIAGVKTVTYVTSIGGTNQFQTTVPQTITTSANLTPVKLTTTGFAYTSTGW